MSKHSSPALTMRDALHEAPGPKMRAKIRIGTAISLVAVAALVALVLQRFYVTGQLSVHYWYFFTHLTTWKFLLAGFEGTVKVALTAGAIALVLGLALMLGRTSDIKPLQLVCRVLTDFFRGVPSLCGELPRPHAKRPRAHYQLRRPRVGLPGYRGHLHPHQRRDQQGRCLCFAQDRRDHHPLTLYHFES